jgi:hypothetical protein
MLRTQVGGGWWEIIFHSFEVREREAVRGYVQRSGFFASEYISFHFFKAGRCVRGASVVIY